MKTQHILAAFFCLTVSWSTIPTAQAANSDAAVTQVLKRLIGAIRYGKNDVAAKQVGFEAMAKQLMGPTWTDMNAAQQKEFIANLEGLIRAISFKRGHEMFKHLDAVLYDAARFEEGNAKVKSTIVVHRNYKKTEVVIDYVLHKGAAGWQVVDLIMMGESTVAGLREDQIKPLLGKGGIDAVLTAMRDKLKQAGS